MKTLTISTILLSNIFLSSSYSFVSRQSKCFTRSCTSNGSKLHMGLFDGVKGAFTSGDFERSKIDAERETPIDRWMGWNVAKGQAPEESKANVNAVKFVDSMDAVNYVATTLEKPMGILFEENDEKFGGIFVLTLTEGGVAEKNGMILPGDQLFAVNDKLVSGMKFDDALGAIVNSDVEKTKLTLFRGTADELYGPAGASQGWVSEFIAGKTVAAVNA